MMRILCDTNLLLRSVKAEDPNHQLALDSLAFLNDRGDQLVLVPQCCYEFFVVATRPAHENGLGLTPSSALQDIEDFMILYRLLRDERAVFEAWSEVVEQYQVKGKPAHDARLVAAMRRHKLTHLLTFNAVDFARYQDIITILTPTEVLASGS